MKISNLSRAFESAVLVGLVGLMMSCSDDVMNPEGQDATASASVSLSTRGEDATSLQSRLCIFNTAGQCVRILYPGVAQCATTQLTPGTYTICAMGSSDLSVLSIPSQEELAMTSEVTLADNEAMPDLLMQQAQVTLGKGTDEQLDIELQRKVFCLTGLSVTQVPEDVDAVQVTLSGLHSGVLLNGSLTEDLTSVSYDLTKGSSGTWSLSPQAMFLPSEGVPGIQIKFVRGEDELTYSYTAQHAFEANQKVQISGTYRGSHGIALMASLTYEALPVATTEESFNFDNANAGLAPEAGARYNNYYVVSVNKTAKTAVLRCNQSVDYSSVKESLKTASESQWMEALGNLMATLDLPVGATEGWRFPTLGEVSIFSSDPTLVTTNNSSRFFCTNNNHLLWGQTRNLSTTPQFVTGDNFYTDNPSLRPVITIAYE
jgi:hypothetical protein